MDEYLENSDADTLDILADQDPASEMGTAVVPAVDPEQQESPPAEVLEVVQVNELLQFIQDEGLLLIKDPEAVQDPKEELVELQVVDPLSADSGMSLKAIPSTGDPMYDLVQYVTSEDGNGLQHYWNTTDLGNITLVEALLMFIFITQFVKFCLDEIRRWLP